MSRSRSTFAFVVLNVVSALIACGTDSTNNAGNGAADAAGPTTGDEAGGGGPDATVDSSTNPPADSSTDADADAGAQWVGPDGGVTTAMTFFVTSKGKGTGGDFRANVADADGLAGADAFCKSLANAVSPLLGAKTWRAYLSTATVSARSRIGNGPWYNAKGVVIATSAANLHDEGAMNALSLTTDLDENGAQVPIAGPNVHDILTGSTAAGAVSPANHCSNWTSSATNVTGQVGHANRAGGGAAPTSWNSAHATTGCAEQGANSVRSGGGRGSIYCFAN